MHVGVLFSLLLYFFFTHGLLGWGHRSGETKWLMFARKGNSLHMRRFKSRIFNELNWLTRCVRIIAARQMADFSSYTYVAEPLQWNAVYTRHQHERSVAENLRGKGFEIYLPTYDVIRKWADRKRRLSLPLFPCYVFLRSNFERCGKILTTPGVYSLVMSGGRPAPIPDFEIDAIRKAVESRVGVEPHPFLRSGDWVRVKSGPLTGLEGILVRKKTSYRLILSLELLGKSIAAEIDAFSVQPLPRRTAGPMRVAGSTAALRTSSFASSR
jgi:transcription antitermination factor NusG